MPWLWNLFRQKWRQQQYDLQYNPGACFSRWQKELGATFFSSRLEEIGILYYITNGRDRLLFFLLKELSDAPSGVGSSPEFLISSDSSLCQGKGCVPPLIYQTEIRNLCQGTRTSFSVAISSNPFVLVDG